jgi:hypothetical protein
METRVKQTNKIRQTRNKWNKQTNEQKTQKGKNKQTKKDKTENENK